MFRYNERGVYKIRSMPKREIKYLCFVILAIGLLCGIIKFSIVFLMPIIIGFLVALILSPFVKFLTKRLKLKKELSIVVLIIGVLGLFISGITVMINWITTDVSNILKNLPTDYDKLRNTVLEVIDKIPFITEKITFGNLLEKLDIGSYISPLVTKVLDIGGSLPDILVKVIFVILFAFFFILNMDKLKSYVPSNIQEIFNKKLKELVCGYFIAQGKLLIVTFFVLFISFILLKVPYAFVLALITSVLDSLPIFGTGAILIPYAIIELIYKNYTLSLGILVIYVVSQIVKRILEPKVLGNTIGLDTFTSVLCLFLGYQFLGVIGLILGIPIGVILKDLYNIGTFNRLVNSIIVIKNWILGELK